MAKNDEVTVKLDGEAHQRLKYTLAVDPRSRGETVKGILTQLADRFVARRLRKLDISTEDLAKAGVPVGALAEAASSDE